MCILGNNIMFTFLQYGTVFYVDRQQNLIKMERLFEAKAPFKDQYALYNIYRLTPLEYKAELISDRNGEYDCAAPRELIISKNDGDWQSKDHLFTDLVKTIGVEIDVFNNGYGALLGRIGIE